MRKKLYIIFVLFICFFLFSIKKADAASVICGSSFADAFEITRGEYSGGSLSEGESCYFSIDVESGYELDIDYKVLGDNFFGNVTIYDESENELSSSDEEEGVLKWLGSSDTQSKYYFVIENSYATDSYNLNISLLDRTDAGTGADAGGDFSDASEIVYGEYDGYLSDFIYGTTGGNDEYDYYKLSVNYGDKVTVRVTPEGDFFAGCAVYDGNRSELFNEEGLDLTSGEIIQESFEIQQDGYIYITVKWPYFGGLESRIDKYNLLVTNETVDDLGEEISTGTQDSDGEKTSNTKGLLIIAFTIILVVLLIVLIVVVISTVAKKKKRKSNKSSIKQKKSHKRVMEENVAEDTNNTGSPQRVKVTVDEGTEVEVKTVRKKEPEDTQ